MRVVFVCSGNRGVSPIISAQSASLKKNNVSVEVKPIIGNGIIGYLSNIWKLKKEIKNVNPDLVHAHYSFCGIVAALSTSKPVITSLMGSDVIHSGPWRWLILFFVKYIWAATIVKSEAMKTMLKNRDIFVIPNGVDLERFKPLNQAECKRQLGWPENKKTVLFAADPARQEKNFELALAAVRKFNRVDIDLRVVHGVPQSLLPLYYNASDIVLLTSIWEGSPNTVKEAMACNVRVVATDVGDISYLFGDTKGCYLSDQTEDGVCKLLIKAVLDNDEPEGRDRIIRLEIDSQSICKSLEDLYLTKV